MADIKSSGDVSRQPRVDYSPKEFHLEEYYFNVVVTRSLEDCPDYLLFASDCVEERFQQWDLKLVSANSRNEDVHTKTTHSTDGEAHSALESKCRPRQILYYRDNKVHIPRATHRPGEDDINLTVTEEPLPKGSASCSQKSFKKTSKGTKGKVNGPTKPDIETKCQANMLITHEVSSGHSELEFSRLCGVLNLWKVAAQKDEAAVIGLLHRDFQLKLLLRNAQLRSIPRTWRIDDELRQSSAHYDNQRNAVSHEPNWTTSGSFAVEKITKLLHASEYAMIIQILNGLPDNLSSDSFVQTHFIYGVCFFKLSDYESSVQHFKKTEAEALKTRRNGDVMLCNAYLGDISYALRKFLIAAEHYKMAIRHYAEDGVALLFKLTPPSLSAIHAKRASSFRNESRMVEAVHEYRTAIERAQVDRDRLSAHTSLGNLYQSMGDNSSALEEYKQSIELAKKLSDHVSLGWAHGNIGNAYLGLNKKDEALHHLQKSLDLAVEYEQTPQAIGRTYNNLGTAYQSMNNLDKAEEYYDLALSQAIYGNDIPGQARVYGNIGNVYMLRKNYERAIPHYSEVLRLSSDPSTVSTARHNRGCAYYEWATSIHKSAQPCSPLNVIEFHFPVCDAVSCLGSIPIRARDLYRKGRQDLEEVVKYHEEKFQHIKGSPKGLTLSVSLFESNSRTFHRLQDCFINLHEWEKAFIVAEQCRARTLGELMLKRKEHLLDVSVTSPLTFELARNITKYLRSPLIYLSYTGARLLGWVFKSDGSSMNMFGVQLDEDQFDGRSFDYYLRYTLTEKLVERSFEMYQSIKYDEDSSSSVQILHKLVAQPIIKLLCDNKSRSHFQELVLISDSYTSLLPLTCLFDSKAHSFFGDQFYLRSIPSLLTLGVMSQMPEVVVDIQKDKREFCIIGDPSIPPFHYNGDIWTLGKLPFARREAEWVAHTLGTTPMLNELATKSALLIRLMKAKVVHIATHGSASIGFLAFAAFMVQADGSSRHVQGKNVLLFPEDIEKLNISPALVVLSSCDSGRGTVKADGIQGMARAFILAGAQSVLTTLWKVPDESASVFMQYFYQYLVDGFKSSLALQKAILSVRCFAKYSQYIHWSGYQLTGRDIQFSNKNPASVDILKQQLGPPSVFPHMEDLKKLKKAFLGNPSLPTDVQILRGSPGVKPSEVAIDFITAASDGHFTGGTFWINCSHQKLIEASIECIEKETCHELADLPLTEKEQALLVLDGMTKLPDSESLLKIMKHQSVHIIVISKSQVPVDKLVKEVDQKLIRGCKVHNIEPLSVIHSTQRLVHCVMTSYDYVPTNDDQQAFEHLAEFTLGSPVIVDIASKVLLHYFETQQNALENLFVSLSFDLSSKKHCDETRSGTHVTVRAISKNVSKYMDSACCATVSQKTRDIWETSSHYDSWDSVIQLIDLCQLSCEERLLLNCLSVFDCCPIPLIVVTELASAIAISSQKSHLAGTLHHRLVKFQLIKRYPLPVVFHSSSRGSPEEHDPVFFYVPQLLSSCIWKNLKEIDQIAALTLTHYTINTMLKCTPNSLWLCSICYLFLETLECNFDLIGKDCYQEIFSLYLKIYTADTPAKITL